MPIRIDKYCWSVRLCKTRSQASELISRGKIKLNQQVVKSSKEVKVGDVLSLHKNTAEFSYKIIEVLEKRISAKLVENYLLETTPLGELEKYKNYLSAQDAYREFGKGKPSKKDRRDLEDFLDW